MKKVILWLSGGLFTAIILLLSLALHQWHVEKPFTLRLYLDREVVKMMLDSPQSKTQLGLHKLGFSEHNANLDDLKGASYNDKLPDLLQVKSVVESYDVSDYQGSLTQRATLYLLDRLIELEPYQYHNYPLDTFAGYQSRYPDFMSTVHPITSLTDAEHYLARLKASERYFQQVIDAINLRAEKGIYPPRVIIDKVNDQMRSFVETPLDNNILLTSLRTRLGDVDSIPQEEQQELYEEAKALVADVVYPMYHHMINTYENLREVAGPHVGMWRMPNGEAAYNAWLHFYTTTDISANEVHRLGIAEVSRIQQEMMSRFALDGIESGNSFSSAFAEITANESLYFPDSATGRTSVLETMQSATEAFNAILPELFSVTDIPPMQFIRSPVLSEKSDSLARYSDNKVLVNLHDLASLPKNELPVLAYHEGIPGHHYQHSVSSTIPGLPLLLSQGPFGAYMEGWAMYAEQLPFKLGMAKTPAEQLAYLHYELQRAGRLVIDSGIHIMRWSREKAISYLIRECALNENEAEIEVDRAIVMPGSGPMYTIGLKKILSMQKALQHRMGEDFSLKAFHNAVLGYGPLPLTLLEEVVSQHPIKAG